MSALHGVCLRVAYDGTDFAGYQIQPGQRTVQNELERAVEKLAGHPVAVRAAGRTDAGVHALGQVVAFDSARLIADRGWKFGLEQHLPDDVRIQHSFQVPVGYNPRYDAQGKLYRYVMSRGMAQDPLMRNRVWHLGKLSKIDVDLMRRGARLLEGTHDYRAFRASDDPHTNTIRTLHSIDVREGHVAHPDLIAIEVHGTAFMKNMVRIIAGTLVAVARERISLSDLAKLFEPGAQRGDAGITAPAMGLTLVEVTLGRRPKEAWQRAETPPGEPHH